MTITTGQRRRLGGGGGAEHLLRGILCTFSWIALSFFGYEEIFEWRRKRTAETSEEVCRLRGPRESKGQEKHAETLWAQVPLHIFSSDQSIHCLFVFFSFNMPNKLVNHMPTATGDKPA